MSFSVDNRSYRPRVQRESDALKSRLSRPCGRRRRGTCGKPDFSPETLHEAVEKRVELGIFSAQLVDLSDRVNNSRVVLSPKASANLGQRGVRQRFA